MARAAAFRPASSRPAWSSCSRSRSALTAAQRIAPQALVERMIPLGVLIYAGTGIAGLLLGKNFLDYSVLARDSAHGHELGIFLVEAGVLVTVSGTMTAVFYAFVERGR